jgi:hypothetical protein
MNDVMDAAAAYRRLISQTNFRSTPDLQRKFLDEARWIAKQST